MEQKTLNKVVLSLGTAVILGLTGCGGSSGGETSSGDSVTGTTVSGTGSDGYISGAIVCLDMNVNNKCDNNASYEEPFTTTDVNGSYSLVVSAADKAKAAANSPILLVGGTDIDTNAKLTGTLKALFDKTATTTTTQITPLTTLVSAMVDKNISVETAYKQVAKALGLTEEEVKSDPVKLAKDSNNTKAIQAAMTIHRVITTMAKSAGTSVSNDDIYSNLVTAINTVADDNTSIKSIATIVTTAADETNSGLPTKAKKAAKVATTIETTISNAIANQSTIKNAALASDEVMDGIQTTVKTALDNNITIDDAFVTSVDTNASATLDSADPVKTAVKNLLSSYLSYGVNLQDADLNPIATHFSSASFVTAEAIIALTSDTAIDPVIISDLQTAYTTEQIKLYVTKNTQIVSDSEVTKIAAISGIDYSTLKTMSLVDFSKKIYDTGDADLMSLSFKLSPPESIASMSDIQKAKNLFTSVRTQVNQADTFTQGESTKIDAALQSVSNSVTFTTTAFNNISDMIVQAIDTNQTTVSRLVSGTDRNVTVSKSASSGNVVWNYTVKDTNVTTPWSGSLTYTDVGDTTAFDPANFTTLTAKLTGTLPIDSYGATIASNKTNSQNVAANIQVVKTSNGATLHLDAVITNNGDSVSIKDANIVIAYDVNSSTKEPLPKYIELKNLYVNGTVGDYTLDGKLDVNSYAVNTISAADGFAQETTYGYIGGQVTCDGNISDTDLNDVKLIYNGVTYNQEQWVIYNGNSANYDSYANTTRIDFGYDNVIGNDLYTTATTLMNYSGLNQCINPMFTIYYSGSWTEDSITNSGHFPSQLTFDGTLTNTVTSAYLNANVNAKWTNIADANLSDANYVANLDITVNGKLAMPESPVMNVGLAYKNIGTSKNINVTYVSADVSITVTTAFSDDNGTKIINLSSTTGINSSITLNGDNAVDYTQSSVTNTNGDTVGTIEDRAGAPVVKYADGTFESLY